MASSSNLSRKRKSITDYFSVSSAKKSNAVSENVTIQSVSNSTVVAVEREIKVKRQWRSQEFSMGGV